jgi:hypothetical protein
MLYITCYERERQKIKRLPVTIWPLKLLHATLYRREYGGAYLWRQRKVIFGLVSHMLAKWHGCYPLIGACSTPVSNFSHLKIQKQYKNTKMPPHDLDNYTKYSREGTKIPSNAKLIISLSFLRLKMYFHCTWIFENLKKTLIQQINNFF